MDIKISQMAQILANESTNEDEEIPFHSFVCQLSDHFFCAVWPGVFMVRYIYHLEVVVRNDITYELMMLEKSVVVVNVNGPFLHITVHYVILQCTLLLLQRFNLRNRPSS